MSKSIPVYQADTDGFFLYATEAHELGMQPGHFNIPYGAHSIAPPATDIGFVARATAENIWETVEDHRRDALYYVKEPATGEKQAVLALYQIGAVIEIDGQAESYDGGGPIPAWLTATPPEPVPQEAAPQLN